MALVTDEDWQILKDHIRNYQDGYTFGLDEYDNMNLTIVSEERDPAKIAVLHTFLGEKVVIGDDILEQLYYEVEQNIADNM